MPAPLRSRSARPPPAHAPWADPPLYAWQHFCLRLRHIDPGKGGHGYVRSCVRCLACCRGFQAVHGCAREGADPGSTGQV